MQLTTYVWPYNWKSSCIYSFEKFCCIFVKLLHRGALKIKLFLFLQVNILLVKNNFDSLVLLLFATKCIWHIYYSSNSREFYYWSIYCSIKVSIYTAGKLAAVIDSSNFISRSRFSIFLPIINWTKKSWKNMGTQNRMKLPIISYMVRIMSFLKF